MKSIEKDQLVRLLEIIPDAPLQRLAHFSDSGHAMTDILHDYCAKHRYEYQLNCTDDAFYEASSRRYEKTPAVTTKRYKLERQNYLLQGKFSEYLFVTVEVPESLMGSFLHKCNRAIKNAGHIILFVTKGDHRLIAKWTELLEENYFVATNTIDLFEHYNLIISKKMHGWGG